MKALAILSLTIAASCVSSEPAMHVPTEAEIRDCEVRGGSIQPAFALNEYVCLLPETAQRAPE